MKILDSILGFVAIFALSTVLVLVLQALAPAKLWVVPLVIFPVALAGVFAFWKRRRGFSYGLVGALALSVIVSTLFLIGRR